jgi:hypothetical protein
MATKRSDQKRDERIGELVANLVVAVICGIIGGLIAFFAMARRGIHSGLLVFAVVAGFMLGASYGLWHAIVGWKRNDAQSMDDDEFRFLG